MEVLRQLQSNSRAQNVKAYTNLASRSFYITGDDQNSLGRPYIKSIVSILLNKPSSDNAEHFKLCYTALARIASKFPIITFEVFLQEFEEGLITLPKTRYRCWLLDQLVRFIYLSLNKKSQKTLVKVEPKNEIKLRIVNKMMAENDSKTDSKILGGEPDEEETVIDLKTLTLTKKSTKGRELKKGAKKGKNDQPGEVEDDLLISPDFQPSLALFMTELIEYISQGVKKEPKAGVEEDATETDLRAWSQIYKDQEAAKSILGFLLTSCRIISKEKTYQNDIKNDLLIYFSLENMPHFHSMIQEFLQIYSIFGALINTSTPFFVFSVDHCRCLLSTANKEVLAQFPMAKIAMKAQVRQFENSKVLKTREELGVLVDGLKAKVVQVTKRI